MERSLLEHLDREATRLGVPLDDAARTRFAKYLELLLFWNRKINLTSIRDEADVVDKHFLDSLAVVPWVPREAQTLVDIGTGPGFPGGVIAIVRPQLSVKLVESNNKKVAFLQTVRRELNLPNLSAEATRAEAVSHHQFDVSVSRATWDLLEWLPIGAQLVKPGGTVLGMEAALQHELPAGAVRHPYELGNATRAIVVFHVEH